MLIFKLLLTVEEQFLIILKDIYFLFISFNFLMNLCIREFFFLIIYKRPPSFIQVNAQSKEGLRSFAIILIFLYFILHLTKSKKIPF